MPHHSEVAFSSDQKSARTHSSTAQVRKSPVKTHMSQNLVKEHKQKVLKRKSLVHKSETVGMKSKSSGPCE